jgi:hypothetical protein
MDPIRNMTVTGAKVENVDIHVYGDEIAFVIFCPFVYLFIFLSCFVFLIHDFVANHG